MATDDQQILVTGQSAVPAHFTISGNGQVKPKTIFASYNGSGSGTAFKPALKIVSDGGELIGIYDTDTTVAAGGSADVTWFPRLASATSGPPPVGQVRLIYDFIVTGASKTTIDTGVDGGLAGPFPTDLNYLEIFLSGRTTGAAKIDDVSFIFNNDTGANYARAFFASSIAGNVQQGHPVGGNAILGVIAGANAAANVSGLSRLFIPNYNNTTYFKVCEFTAWGNDTTTIGNTPTTFPFQIGVETAMWTSTAALSRVAVFCTGDTNPAGNLDIGTRLTIWGR